MQLLRFPALLLLISTSYGENTMLSTGLVTNIFATSAIIALPTSCNYTNLTATLYVTGPTSQSQNFIVPQCRLKRELSVIRDPTNGNMETVNVGVRVTGLNANSTYTAQYVIGGNTFDNVTFTTVDGSKDPPTIFARSGGMVVITVLLSIAMFLLLVGLIVVLVLGGRSTK